MKTLSLHRFFLAAALFAAAASAQTAARFTGTVVDPTDAPVVGAKVNLLIAGGQAPIQTTTTNEQGVYRFAALQPIEYDIAVESPGFRKEVLRKVKAAPGIDTPVQAVKLEVGSIAEVVEVSAEIASVQTNTVEISQTVTNQQISRLPSLNRSPLAFIQLQAGVGTSGRAATTINGLRPSFANVTLDGINIQDNFIRTNTLDFQPNMLQLDQVAEFTVTSSNSAAGAGSGATQVTFVTPSGTNTYHGSLYWYNRNNVAAASSWFNNRSGIKKAFLNQNQLGGSLGGRIIRDKLYFYSNVEVTRTRAQSTLNRTVLRGPARQGIFTYRDTGGNTRQINVLQTAGVTADSTIAGILQRVPGPEVINRDDIGDGLNTGGFSFLARNNRTRDNITNKIDYILNTKHSFTGTYIWNRDLLDRPTISGDDFSPIPKVQNDNSTPLLSTVYRWTPTATFVNEARGGGNFAPGIFASSENVGNAIFGLPLVSNPVQTFLSQGRYTDTYNIQDNATWYKGKHNIAFGYQGMLVKVKSFGAPGIPAYGLGISTANRQGLVAAQVPGVRSAADLAIANGLLALQAGFIATAAQTFNATSRTSGFVGNARPEQNFTQWNHAFYINDNFKMTPRLTLTAGMRWEYWMPVDEDNAMALMPVVQNGNAINTLLSNSTLDFAGRAVGRPWYGKDFNNFGPNVGIAWQPFGDRKTVIRAGYSINFPNDEFIRSLDNNTATNAGLSQGVTRNNLVARASAPPAIPAPTFKVPRTFADNYAANTGSAFGLPDPTLRAPYVQQWSFGVQREIKGGILEARYVGNHATKQFRAFDYNQVVIKSNGFLDDFRRAQNNLNLARAAGRGNDPAYNPAIPGSQRLPVFDRLEEGGALSNAGVRLLIDTGAVGELATLYQVNEFEGANFFRNRFALGTNMVTNYSNASYNALQVDYTRRFSNGWQFQANYTFAKSLSDAAGDGQTRFEPFLDIDNPKIERAPTPFDLRHAFKMNGYYELPFGRGKKFNISNRVLEHIAGGWSTSGFMTWTTGPVFGVYSSRGTVNRAGRSGQNTANTDLNYDQLDALIGLRVTGNGPYWLAQSAIGRDGRGVAADGAPRFDGQVFSHPAAGTLGALQRRLFTGPRFWNTDISIQKTFRLYEAHRVEFRADMFNFTNTPSFFTGDQGIDSVNFGRITAMNSAPRIMQFGLHYRF